MDKKAEKEDLTKSETAKREEEVLSFWDKNKIFEKSEEKDSPKGEFVFYDGPPFATGLPHYGHILAGTIKDAIPRYKTMRGYSVRRRWGWDCHGLPLEAIIESELGIKTKKDIEELGVGKFNSAARDAVLRYADDWKKIVPRLGRWVDMERDYKTMDANYTESVWWVFNELHKKGLVYKGYKVLYLSPLLGTELSNFEVSQNYQDIEDVAVTVKLPLTDKPNTSILVWTTTAWTLPGNMAAAVNKDFDYVKIKMRDEFLVLAKERLDTLDDEYEVVDEFKGSVLVGESYEPPFAYFKDKEIEGKENAWKIYHAPYVTLEEGTGIVHLAPAYGAEDMELAEESNVPVIHHVNKDGTFKEEVRDFRGMQAKPKGDHQRTDALIADNLKARGLLFKKETVMHSYPHCWRTDAPLLNYAMDSWFVRVIDFKDKLVSENNKVKWVPKEVGSGRFGNWLENARDWSVSRSRYWGAPLPVWQNKKTGEYKVIGSVEELKRYTKKKNNNYFVMRHGEAESNAKNILSSDPKDPVHLTENGKEQVKKAAESLKEKNISVIYHSPLLRAKETAELIAKEIGISKEKLVIDKRIAEMDFGEFSGGPIQKYYDFFASVKDQFNKKVPGGENLMEVKRRSGEFIYDIDSKHENETILVVTHDDTAWMLASACGCLVGDRIRELETDGQFIKIGEIQETHFEPLPHNENYELDLHRPYIDEIELIDSDGSRLKRIPDVFDCWFESGSMPYGQFHYPFENTKTFEPKSGLFRGSRGFPADFIAESIDQTRGWFYSLIVLGVGLFGKSPYKNVITNGLVLAEDGKKMSKRLQNYPDPLYVANKYGADSMRYYLLSSSIMRGEDLNFSERGVDEILKKVILRLSNVHSFFALYDKGNSSKLNTKDVLDRWILTRLNQLIKISTDGLENYEIDKATRPIADFIEDLSVWYLRRSRDRFKGDDEEDKNAALGMTKHVLFELSKTMAPFMPFYSEHLYQKLRGKNDPESVHLSSWPEGGNVEEQLLKDMKEVRSIVSSSLELRSSADIKVRQPLQTLFVPDDSVATKKEYASLIKDEVNVKEVKGHKGEIKLDTDISKELKEEGLVREFLRHVQELRKKEGLTPEDRPELTVEAEGRMKEVLEEKSNDVKKMANLGDFLLRETSGEEISLEGNKVILSLKK
ncbi:MAG: class I tRNA ligase family protein [Candidatus Pacebacteria bacterium]|jgi:isoleucyl-tRNA synthetase|nr:isoleucine--tRNA ligase [bacterium]MDP6527396.1 class I tRNA ligase family protein [Candidatus Paceibacterota bacterium]MDP6659522.1 class I tRNA ligase family protein [Candidatus Paceibacterota bacterium]|tara:strand:- start:27079 stop:30561 length:3483 start_codon:yes stop_codon:yes gene_type:complete